MPYCLRSPSRLHNGGALAVQIDGPCGRSLSAQRVADDVGQEVKSTRTYIIRCTYRQGQHRQHPKDGAERLGNLSLERRGLLLEVKRQRHGHGDYGHEHRQSQVGKKC